MNKISTKIVTIALMALLLEVREANAILYVIDADNLANSAKQVAYWKEQLDAMKKQLEQNAEQYKALTGSRGLGKVLHDPSFYNNLPPSFKTIYNKILSGNYEIADIMAEITNDEKLLGSTEDMQKNIEERSMRTSVINKAIGLKGYEGTDKRLAKIEALMDEINNTEDPKGISELQARIEIEQALLQNETNKLQMISQLQRAEVNLIEEQKRELSRRLLNSKNTKMPRIK